MAAPAARARAPVATHPGALALAALQGGCHWRRETRDVGCSQTWKRRWNTGWNTKCVMKTWKVGEKLVCHMKEPRHKVRHVTSKTRLPVIFTTPISASQMLDGSMERWKDIPTIRGQLHKFCVASLTIFPNLSHLMKCSLCSHKFLKSPSSLDSERFGRFGWIIDFWILSAKAAAAISSTECYNSWDWFQWHESYMVREYQTMSIQIQITSDYMISIKM